MAEIDFRIPLGLRPIQTQSIAPTLLALGRLKRGQQQGRLNEQLLAKGEAEAAQAVLIQEALATLGQRSAARPQPGAPGAIDVPFQAISPAQGQVSQELPGGTISPQALAPGAQPQQQAPGVPTPAQILQSEEIFTRNEVFAVANRVAVLGNPELARQLIAFHDAKIDSTIRELDLKKVQMTAAGNIADLITDQESLDRWRSRLQTAISLVWPNQRVPTVHDPRVFAEIRDAGLSSAEEQARFRTSILQEKSTAAAAKEARVAREAAGQIRDFGLTPTGNAKAAELFPNHPQGQPLSGEQAGQVNAALATEKAQGFAQIRASVAAGVAQARAANIRLTPQQLDKTVNRSEILGIAEAITKEFPDAELRKVFGLKNLLVRGAATARGNPKVLRLLALTGRLRSALLFDKEKGGGSALSENEQAALESSIITGTELTAEQFIQKRNILQTVAQSTFETGLEGALGSNPKELKRMQALLAKQRLVIQTTTPTAPVPASPRRNAQGDTSRQAQIRQQLNAQGMTNTQIDKALGR